VKTGVKGFPAGNGSDSGGLAIAAEVAFLTSDILVVGQFEKSKT
jgi:hypothetical protein